MSRDTAAEQRDLTLRLGLLLAFGLGIFFRVFHFGSPSLWMDEYGTWWTVAAEGYGGVFDRAVEIQGQSPLYYLLVRVAVDICGVAPWSLRLVSLLSGIALLWVGVRVAHALFHDNRVTLAVGAAFAVDTSLIFYSQDARPYSLALLLATISVWSYLTVLRGGGRIPAAVLCVTTALTWYSHWLFAVILVVAIGHLLATKPWKSGTGRRWLGLGLITAALMAPGLWQFATLFGRRASLDWVRSSWSSLATDLLVFDVHPYALGFALATVGVLAFFFSRRISLAKLDPSPRRLVLIWFCAPILVLGVLPPLVGVSLLSTRYMLIIVPALLIITGVLVAWVRTDSWHDRLPMCAFVIAVYFSCLMPIYDRYGLFSPRRENPWNEIAADIEANHLEGDVVLYATGFVELDAVVAEEASAATVSFVEFPLLAHLDAAARLPRHALPFGQRPDAIDIMNKTLQSAQSAKRVWVVGGGKAMDYFLTAFVTRPTVQVILNQKHGDLRTVLVQFR